MNACHIKDAGELSIRGTPGELRIAHHEPYSDRWYFISPAALANKYEHALLLQQCSTESKTPVHTMTVYFQQKGFLRTSAWGKKFYAESQGDVLIR